MDISGDDRQLPPPFEVPRLPTLDPMAQAIVDSINLTLGVTLGNKIDTVQATVAAFENARTWIAG